MVCSPFRLMSSSLLDPNNHVPELTPDDDWGDLEDNGSDALVAPSTVLPPRRTLVGRASAVAVTLLEGAQTGLRIEPHLVREEFTGTPPRLEVQQLNGPVIRLEQIAAPPRVPRQVIFHERPAQDSHREDLPEVSLQWGLSRRGPSRWILGAGVAVAAIVVLVMTLLPAINAPNAPRAGPAAQPFVEERVEGIEEMNLLLGKESEAVRIFHSYATAVHVDETISLLRDGQILRKTLETHWQAREISRSWEPAGISSWTVPVLAGHPRGLLEGTFPDQSKFAAYFTIENNRLLLDWKATSGFGTATFGQLQNNLGDPSEIRGEISSAEYYSEIFPEADYRSYSLSSPDGEIVIWCYARRGEGADQVIAPILHKSDISSEFQRSQKATLRLARGPAGALPNQWLIGEILQLDWVTP